MNRARTAQRTCLHRLVASTLACVAFGGCAQSVTPTTAQPARDAGAVDDSIEHDAEPPSEASERDGALLAISLSAATGSLEPSIARWTLGELGAIARGHSAFGYFFPQRAEPVGEERSEISRAFRSRVLARWRAPVGLAESLRAAPTPFAFEVEDGRAALWVAHGAPSGSSPSVNRAATGQLARLGEAQTLPQSPAQLDALIRAHKLQVGATRIGLAADAYGEWEIDRASHAHEFNATDRTRGALAGFGSGFDDRGEPLAEDVVGGVVGCSGGTLAPWGTALLLESTAARAYGELELALRGDSLVGRRSSGFEPGAIVRPRTAGHGASDFGSVSDSRLRHRRDEAGYVVELDPRADTAQSYDRRGVGQRKLAALGRGHWRGVAIAPRAEGTAPITVYAVDGRAGGRLFKFVTVDAVSPGSTAREQRDALANTRVFVAHFAGLTENDRRSVPSIGGPPTVDREATGRWIELSTRSGALAPDGATTVRDALADPLVGGVGAFADDATVRLALSTAAAKIGVAPADGLRSIAIEPTRGSIVLAAHGVGGDAMGSILSLRERGAPHAAGEFLWAELWHGHEGDDWFSAAHPAALTVDALGTVWFATECEPALATCARSEGLFVLDRGAERRDGEPTVRVATWGLALRVATAPVGAVFSAPVFDRADATMFVGVRPAGAFEWAPPEEQW